MFTFVAGWPTVFTRGNNLYECHFWIPIVGPVVGAVLGSKELFTKLNIFLFYVHFCNNSKLYSVSIGTELERQQISATEGTYRKVSDSRQDDEAKINEESDI